MKIAYISTAKVPSREANSIQTMKMCSALAEAGNDVTLILPQYHNLEDVDDIYQFYGLTNNFKIDRIKFLRFRYAVYVYAYNMARYLKKGDFKCIYGRNILSCFIISKLVDAPFFFEAHAPIDSKRKFNIIFQNMIKSRNFMKLVVITKALERHFLTNYAMKSSQILVAPDAADPYKETGIPAKLADKSTGMFHIGYIGHLYQGKGMEVLGAMIPRCENTFFHIIGGMEDDIAFWKNSLQKCNNVHFYGFVPQAQAVAYGKAMDVLVAPYQNSVKGVGSDRKSLNLADWMSPLKLFEYMSLNKPIICSDLPVLREALTDNENCLMCPPENVDCWCEALQKLRDDPRLSDMLAQNALRLFEEKYTWRKRAQVITDMIKSSI